MSILHRETVTVQLPLLESARSGVIDGLAERKWFNHRAVMDFRIVHALARDLDFLKPALDEPAGSPPDTFHRAMLKTMIGQLIANGQTDLERVREELPIFAEYHRIVRALMKQDCLILPPEFKDELSRFWTSQVGDDEARKLGALVPHDPTRGNW